jgi:hypothetical protein
MVLQMLPSSLLWQPPLANQREPRSYFKITSRDSSATYDTAVGGEFGLFRLQPPDSPNEGLQLDVFAVVFTRFADHARLVAADYRAGLPLTYAKGPYQLKFAFEHTGTHLGDEYIAATGAQQISYFRDDLVAGAAVRLWDDVRVYGQLGVAVNASSVTADKPMRYDVGVEWSGQDPTGPVGEPYAALDLELREDQDYTGNLTVQLGWQWRVRNRTRAPRVGVEFYTGRSPFGQFYLDRERWVGLAAMWDW